MTTSHWIAIETSMRLVLEVIHLFYIVKKYNSLMHGIKFESFAKLIFEWKKSIYVWVYLFAVYVLYLFTKEALSSSLFRPWLRHNWHQNLIRVLHCV